MESKVLEFKSLSAFSEYVRREGLKLEVLAKHGRMSVVGAFNLKHELIAKVAGYSPKGA